MGGLRSRVPRNVLPWLVACVLLAIGTLTALINVSNVSKAELARANSDAQRVLIDPATGVITGLAKKAAPEEDDDKAEAKPDAKPEVKPDEKPVADAAKPSAAAASAKDIKPAAAPTNAAPASAADALTPNPSTAPKLLTQIPNAEIPKATSSGESIVSPPAAEITEQKNGLALPKIGDTGASASTLYAKNFPLNKELPRVSLVITDAGFNTQSLELLLRLPHTVTIAVSPYAPDTAANITMLHVAGYETWGMLPVMGARYPQNDPGPLGLIASLPPEENQRRLDTAMAATLGAVGMVLPADESLSQHGKIFATTLYNITSRGLYVLSTQPAHSVESLAGANKALIPSIHRVDVQISANSTPAEIQSKLDGLQALAAKQPALIVAIPARPQILALLADWLKHNGLGPNVQIAPLSAMYKQDAPPPADDKKDAKKSDDKKPDDAKPTDASADKKPDAKPDADTKKDGGDANH